MNLYYVYVQQNKKGFLYKGYTSNIIRRRVEHLLHWSPYSRRFGPSVMIYFEMYSSRSQAVKREKFFKTGKGREFLAQYRGSQNAESYSSG